MDIPTLVVLSAFIVSIAITFFLKVFRASPSRSLNVLFFSILPLWAVMTVLGEFVFMWASNSSCSKYLGCVTGFFGYDAFEHMFFGTALTLGIFWLSEHFPKYSLLHLKRWKTVITILALVAFVAVIWEIGECIQDTFSIEVLHEVLVNHRLHLDLLSQASNLDTMGDLTFALIGSVGAFISVSVLRVWKIFETKAPTD